MNLPKEPDIAIFAMRKGGREVHRAWRDHMLMDDREVADKRMEWETLSEEDKRLDVFIAYALFMDFMNWLEENWIKEPTLCNHCGGPVVWCRCIMQHQR